MNSGSRQHVTRSRPGDQSQDRLAAVDVLAARKKGAAKSASLIATDAKVHGHLRRTLEDFGKAAESPPLRDAGPAVSVPADGTTLTASASDDRKLMALLLPGHNEELLIQATITSAIASGQCKEDIFVVDDSSSDTTRTKAVTLLGNSNVLTVARSGKALAVHQAIEHFEIVRKYHWVHVADADSVFGRDYFTVYRRSLDGEKYAAAVGFVQSLRGNWISKYRVYSYTYGQHILRRVQSWAGMISVFPGPVTSFRTDVINKLDFAADSLTEDFDLTLQFHRLKLGKVLYIPAAVNYTQDPQTLRDFCKQTSRWHRGLFQGIKKYRIGRRLQAIDAYISYQLLETLFYLTVFFVILPLVVIRSHPHRWIVFPELLLADFLLTSILALVMAIVARRWSIMSVFAAFYLLRIIELTIFTKAFVEVVILRKFNSSEVGWQTEGRRYALDENALQDTAQ